PPSPLAVPVATGSIHSAASVKTIRDSGGWPAASTVLGAGGAALAVEPRPTTARRLEPVPTARAIRPRRETARVILRDGSRVWPVAIAFAAALVLIAAAVHLAVVPLDVLVVWRKPATLAVTSEPPGALVRLDGVAMPGATPMSVPVRRDRYEHVLQLTSPGFRPVRMGVRFDRTIALSATARLEHESAPAWNAVPALEAAPAAAAPARVAAKATRPVKVAKKATKGKVAAKTKVAKRTRVAAARR
ncbi:MAG TPA: PEGA domain-containing protein, partial [Polyangia bacterium]|nr:PEGA domain-containing protein [Polyangia bacterium]